MPNDVVAPGATPDESFDGFVLDKAVRLGKKGKNADGFEAIATTEPSHPKTEHSSLEATQVAEVIAKCPESSRSTTMGTDLRGSNLALEILPDILLDTDWYDADQLHPHNLLTLWERTVNPILG